jgi:hypothetical protein
LGEFRYRVDDSQAGAGGAFGIVLVRLRPPEIGHHAIAEILGDVTTVSSYRFGSGAMIPGHQLAPFFRVELGSDFG